MKATYQLQVYGCGIWLGQEPIEIEGDCQQNGDDVAVKFTSDTEALIEAFGLDRTGCEETMIAAFDESEREACRVLKVRQQLGIEPSLPASDAQLLFVALSVLGHRGVFETATAESA